MIVVKDQEWFDGQKRAAAMAKADGEAVVRRCLSIFGPVTVAGGCC
jgi:hypothetical protein